MRLIRLFDKVLFITALAAFWVFIEWVRSLFSFGFPWCPLSVTQWERPAILQLVPFFGGWIVSFFSNFLQSMLTLLLTSPFGSRKEGESTKWLLFITLP